MLQSGSRAVSDGVSYSMLCEVGLFFEDYHEHVTASLLLESTCFHIIRKPLTRFYWPLFVRTMLVLGVRGHCDFKRASCVGDARLPRTTSDPCGQVVIFFLSFSRRTCSRPGDTLPGVVESD
jgi:hypothetical protein